MQPINATLCSPSDFMGWRSLSRDFLNRQVEANAIHWSIQEPDILYAPQSERILPNASSPLKIPRFFGRLMSAVFASSLPDRFDRLYRALEHIQTHGEPSTRDLQDFEQVAAEVRTQILALRNTFPENRILDWQIIRTDYPPQLIDSQIGPLGRLRTAPWILLSDARTLCWDGQDYRIGPALTDTPLADVDLISHAQQTATATRANAHWHGLGTVHVTPTDHDTCQVQSLPALRSLAVDCSFCDLCHHATRTVFGEGSQEARLLFVGEQPGDQEDLQGRPFVGPAGQLFDRALQEAGGDRHEAWISNAVKHFKFVRKGNRRIHQKPGSAEVHACAPWVAAERRILSPKVTVMLGVTGASALLGRPVTVSRERSRLFSLEDGSIGLVTVHPSYLLRLPDDDAKTREYIKFVADLRMAISALA
jgi:DNA polymerase